MSEELFGGKTRSSILETLANARKPISAYSIAKVNDLDVKTTYDILDRLSGIGIVKPVTKGKKQTAFKLDNNIRKAVKTLIETAKIIDFDVWMRPRMQGKRLIELARVRVPAERKKEALSADSVDKILSLRAEGELGALIKVARSSFNKMFQSNGEFVHEYQGIA